MQTKHHQDVSKVLSSYRKTAEKREAISLHPKATLSQEHNRYFGTEDDHRLPYKRDVDRIVHSKAYARYVDKTQVVYLVKNDHITHRSLHVPTLTKKHRLQHTGYANPENWFCT